jgi:hypothetical protein
MPRLVVGRATAVLLFEDHAPGRAEQDLLQRIGEIGHLHGVMVQARTEQCRFVGEIG